MNTSIKPRRLREVPGFAEAVAWLSEAYAHEPSRWERTGDVLMPVALEKVDYVIVQSLADVIAHAQAMTDHHRRAMRAGLRVFKGGAAAVAGANAPCTPWWRADEPVHLQVLWERPVENDNDPEVNWTHWRRLTWIQAAWVQRAKERRLLHVGTETTRDADGRPWHATAAVISHSAPPPQRDSGRYELPKKDID